MTEMKAQLLTELPYHRVRDNTLQTLCEIRSGHSMTLKFKNTLNECRLPKTKIAPWESSCALILHANERVVARKIAN